MPVYPGNRAKPVRVADHDPDAIDRYEVDWTDWLEAVDETLATSTWMLPEGLVNEGASLTGYKTVVQLSGGVAGTTYRVTNRITTAPHGLVQDRSFYFCCREY